MDDFWRYMMVLAADSDGDSKSALGDYKIQYARRICTYITRKNIITK